MLNLSQVPLRTTLGTSLDTGLSGVRRGNLERVLRAVAQGPGSSQTQLQSATSLAAGAISSLVNELLEEQLLVEGPQPAAKGRGRPQRRLYLPDGPVDIVGVVITRDGVLARSATLAGRVLSTASRSLPAPIDFPSGTDLVMQLIDEALGDQPPRRGGPRVVISIPGGILDDAMGSTELDWESVSPRPLEAAVTARGWRAPLIGNDGSLATLAEASTGAASGTENAVVLYLGRGLGGSAIIDGALIRGAASGAGFGHTPLGGGGPCVCGLEGCAELSVSLGSFARTLGEEGRLASLDPSSYARDLEERARAEEPAVLAMLHRARERLSQLTGVAGALLNPELIVLTGEGSLLFPWLNQPSTSRTTSIPVVAGLHGADAVALGALEAGRQMHFTDPLAGRA